MPAIEVSNLQRAFSAEVLAVAGIDLEVAEGEIYAFLGPNGAGKTTTVRMLTTLLRPTGGTARVAGFDVVDEPAAVRSAIGVALQEAALDPLMTGRELIRMPTTSIPRARPAPRGDLLRRVGLTEAGDRRVGTYSGGMKRRLDLASSLVHEPRVLFLDEPTTGLDPVSRKSIWEEVEALNREGTTVFLTTQYLEEADQLADRVGIIAKGRIVAEDTPTALKTQVGKPRMEIVLAKGERSDCVDVLGGFEICCRRTAADARRSPRAAAIAVVETLDEAGIVVESLDVVEPTSTTSSSTRRDSTSRAPSPVSRTRARRRRPGEDVRGRRRARAALGPADVPAPAADGAALDHPDAAVGRAGMP